MLQVQNISFSYNKTLILEDISFSVKRGEHLSIIGESGSGKSTLLKLIYGEYDLNQGQIFWNKNEILGPEHNLVIGYEFMKRVTQEFDEMPYITVSENIGKHLSNTNPIQKTERIKELLEVVELSEFYKTKVKLLSGGQKQRVALARAIAKEPEMLLLDEPFSHIDNFKKQSLRRSLFSYLKEQNICCIVATHNSEDVLGYSDNMIVLESTKIVEYGTPKHIYNNPKNNLIASFFGEFNEIPEHGFVYSHQLKVVEKSDLVAIVKNTYFKGNFFLIEALLNNQIVFFETPLSLAIDSCVFLNVDKI